jgi:hypothetical protein
MIMRFSNSFGRIKLVAALGVAASLAFPSLAGAQSYPSYATAAQQTIKGTITGFNGQYTVYVQDEKGYGDNVQMHDGTVINPTGIRLQAGMRVTIYGYANGPAFQAYRIDTQVSSYGYGGGSPYDDGYGGGNGYGGGYGYGGYGGYGYGGYGYGSPYGGYGYGGWPYWGIGIGWGWPGWGWGPGYFPGYYGGYPYPVYFRGPGGPFRGGVGAPFRGGVGAPFRGGVGAPVRGGVGAPFRGGVGAPVRGGVGAPVRGGVGAPVHGGMGAPSQGGVRGRPPR